jgi:hypothetical protein
VISLSIVNSMVASNYVRKKDQTAAAATTTPTPVTATATPVATPAPTVTAAVTEPTTHEHANPGLAIDTQTSRATGALATPVAVATTTPSAAATTPAAAPATGGHHVRSPSTAISPPSARAVALTTPGGKQSHRASVFLAQVNKDTDTVLHLARLSMFTDNHFYLL